MHDWIHLTGRWGMDTKNPARADLKKALSELFDSPEDDEHPDAWLTCGSENGPLYTVNIFSSGYAIFTVYDDADMRTELQRKEISNINHESGLLLWENLIKENYEGI
ncbi:hypothetical protein [Undibacterium pigrum]|uniref:Uncharacterized protein n=1 Tax=Undibacterium pigrum TaxID=401470 RepID=A0A318IMU0_9BURK|nr:hypothetical protein [Undibacterium pigrum]PXX33714.1 hypothetical protein DFR42_12910 [Undibacterium pigrum]